MAFILKTRPAQTTQSLIFTRQDQSLSLHVFSILKSVRMSMHPLVPWDRATPLGGDVSVLNPWWDTKNTSCQTHIQEENIQNTSVVLSFWFFVTFLQNRLMERFVPASYWRATRATQWWLNHGNQTQVSNFFAQGTFVTACEQHAQNRSMNLYRYETWTRRK